MSTAPAGARITAVSEEVWNERIAAAFDADAAEMFDPAVVDPAVNVLAELAGQGSALEFGIGTGRIAIPLQARGVRVAGIDISQPMLEQLRRKPGAETIEVLAGSCADATVGGAFDLVYAVWNTFTNLLTQHEQVDCFKNAAAHLVPGGHFLIEGGVPTVTGDAFQRYSVFAASPDHIGFDELLDGVAQQAVSHHFFFEDGQVTKWDSPHRFVWPSELDLMGEIAGLELQHRWQGWDRHPFSDTSTSHVSIWRKPL